MTYDIIIVGSGNGACGFLSHYLEATAHHPKLERVLVLEEGDDFFDTSDITHQNNWTQSYAEGDLFKLHNASTPDGIPIRSGRACCMGGGGSINYTMIHESSQWLTKNIGKTETYWNQLKEELNHKFARKDPESNQSPVTQHIVEVAKPLNFEISKDKTCNIPNFQEGNKKLVHLFPTQFNLFGQRTNSGVSLLDWNDTRLKLKTKCRVVKLEFSNLPGKQNQCVGVSVQYVDTGKTESFYLSEQGKIILCAGAATPRLLLPYQDRLQNPEIGKYVNDHILLPLGIYILDKKIDATSRDVYIPVFATTIDQAQEGQRETVCCFDFFSGNLDKLLFIVSHLYLAFLPNCFKKVMLRIPGLFWLTKNLIRWRIQGVNLMLNLWLRLSNLLRGGQNLHKLDLVTAIVKFNPAREGYYSSNDSQIALCFFSEHENSSVNHDKEVAKRVIKEQIKLLNNLGKQPPLLIRFLIRCLTKIPYKEEQVDKYVDLYSKKFLLSEQHLSGGCLFGKAIDKGLKEPKNTGKLNGATNVYVADLSSVPLPRISPQMTAYLIGFHVAKMLCSDNK